MLDDILGASTRLLATMVYEIYVMFYPKRCHGRLRVLFVFLRLTMHESLDPDRFSFNGSLLMSFWAQSFFHSLRAALSASKGVCRFDG